MTTADHTLRPEDLDEFRQARLLLLSHVISSSRATIAADLERLSYYDFFSANPFLVANLKSSDRVHVSLAGFDSVNLSYQSASQRFTNNRARLQFDLAALVARNLLEPRVVGGRVTYVITDLGIRAASSLSSLYAQSYRSSAEVIVNHIRRLSDTTLRQSAKAWLKADALLIDLYDVEPGSA